MWIPVVESIQARPGDRSKDCAKFWTMIARSVHTIGARRRCDGKRINVASLLAAFSFLLNTWSFLYSDVEHCCVSQFGTLVAQGSPGELRMHARLRGLSPYLLRYALD